MAPECVEITPDPRDGECVVFRDFFSAGLRFPLDPVFPKILARFGLRMHHLTPNAIVQLSKFFWAVKTFDGPINVDALHGTSRRQLLLPALFCRRSVTHLKLFALRSLG